MNQDVLTSGGARASSTSEADQAQVATIVSEMREYVQLRWPAYYPGRAGSAPVITITPLPCDTLFIARSISSFAASTSSCQPIDTATI